MAHTDWSMKGPEYGNCNCAWGCPCQFNALPTDGSCRAVISMRIDEGHFGDVRLDGLHWVGTYSWPGAVHEGNGSHQAIIDERADDQQRAALDAILHGRETEPGATMLQIYSTVVDKVFDTLYMPIEFEVDVEARRARLAVPGMIESSGEPIRNPVTGNIHRARIDLPHGFEYSIAEIGSGTTKASGAIPLEFEGSYGQFAMLNLTQNGPVR